MGRRIPQPKLTEDNKILLSKGGDQFMGTIVNTAVLNDIDSEEKKFYWKKRIKPSSISLDMCIEEYQATCHLQNRWKLRLKLKFLIGNAIHQFIGKYIAQHYPEIVYPASVPESVEKWYGYVKPEVPIFSEKWMTKACLDFPARIKGKPVIIDWKTVYMEPKEWIKFCQDPFVSNNYIMQAASYCFLTAEENYFDQPVEQFGFAFLNMKVSPDDEYFMREVYFDYAQYAGPIQYLWELLREATLAKIEDKMVPCRNQYCKLHGRSGARLVDAPMDPRKPQTPSLLKELDYAFVRENKFVDHCRTVSELIEGARTWDVR